MASEAVAAIDCEIFRLQSCIQASKSEVQQLRELLQAAEKRLEADRERVEDLIGEKRHWLSKDQETHRTNQALPDLTKDQSAQTPSTSSRRRARAGTRAGPTPESKFKVEVISDDEDKQALVKKLANSDAPLTQPAPKRSKRISERIAPEQSSQFAHDLIAQWEPYALVPSIQPTTKFSRTFISGFLGGATLAHVFNISEMKLNAQRIAGIHVPYYSCEDTTWNPFLPQKPGDHGYIYFPEDSMPPVGFLTTSVPLFCSRTNKKHWEYCGDYKIQIYPIGKGEWQMVDHDIKKRWATACTEYHWGTKMLAEKGLIEKIDPDTVLRLVDEGLVKLETWTYKCVGFNLDLYNRLNEAYKPLNGGLLSTCS